VKIKLIDILNSIETLEKLNQERFEDGITSYRVARNIKNINIELEHIDKAKNMLIEKYGERDDKGAMSIPKEKRDTYNKEVNSLLEEEIELNILQISPAKLSGHSPMEFLSIYWMLCEEA
jgi:hypothetical protein